MENKLRNICVLNGARKGRGWSEGRSSELGELEKLLISPSNGLRFGLGATAVLHPHIPLGACVWILQAEETC